MNLANKLTLSRIVLTFAFMTFLFLGSLAYKILALVVFVVAMVTDFLDGYIAKTRNEITDFGKFMDPIADKVLVIAAFLAFVEMKLVPAWIVVIIVFREFVITGLRLMAFTKGQIIEAETAGKHKTVSQMLSIYLILCFIILQEGGNAVFGFWNVRVEHASREIIFYILVITALLTVASGISYILKNRHFISHARNK